MRIPDSGYFILKHHEFRNGHPRCADDQVIALLAAILEQLMAMNDRNRSPTDDKLLSNCPTRALSVRSRKALFRSGARFLSDLTPELLLNIKNCGEVSANEIMQWKQDNLAQ